MGRSTTTAPHTAQSPPPQRQQDIRENSAAPQSTAAPPTPRSAVEAHVPSPLRPLRSRRRVPTHTRLVTVERVRPEPPASAHTPRSHPGGAGVWRAAQRPARRVAIRTRPVSRRRSPRLRIAAVSFAWLPQHAADPNPRRTPSRPPQPVPYTACVYPVPLPALSALRASSTALPSSHASPQLHPRAPPRRAGAPRGLGGVRRALAGKTKRRTHPSEEAPSQKRKGERGKLESWPLPRAAQPQGNRGST